MKKEITVLPGLCDSRGQLGFSDIFTVFMDLASEAAEQSGSGFAAMAEKDLFWLTVQTTVRFFRFPRMMSRLTAETWTDPPNRLYVNRYYTLEEEGKRVAEGKTKWAVLNRTSGRIIPLDDPFFLSLPSESRTVCDGETPRVKEEFGDCPVLGMDSVRSVDVDLGGHRNNAAYLRAVEAAFSAAEWNALHLRQAEIFFRKPCFEGELLTLRRRDTASGMEIGMMKSDGTPGALLRLTLDRS